MQKIRDFRISNSLKFFLGRLANKCMNCNSAQIQSIPSFKRQRNCTKVIKYCGNDELP